MKKILMTVCALSMVLSMSAFAKTIDQTQTFTTENNDQTTYASNVNFDEKMTKDDTEYKLKDIVYETSKTEYPDARQKTITSDSAPSTKEFDGLTYQLISKDAVTETMTARSSKNNFPKTKDGMTFKGSRIVSNTDGEKDVVVTFSGADGWGYEWNGNEIESDDNGPVLGDLADEFAQSLGGTFKSIKWRGPAKNGSREAVCTIITKVPQYEATYTKTTYNCVYEHKGQPRYTVTATATYEAAGENSKATDKASDKKETNAKKRADDKKETSISQHDLFTIGLASGVGIAALIALAVVGTKRIKQQNGNKKKDKEM